MANSLSVPPFRTAVWNMFGPTAIEKSAPALDDTIKWGVSLWIVCEAPGKDRDRLFRSRGLETVKFGQHRIAWDPNRWTAESDWNARLSETHWFKRDRVTPAYSEAKFATLVDKVSTQVPLKLEVGSYHMPAHIQYDESVRPKARYKAFVESLLFLAAQANESAADGVLYGGDDNWDEDGPNEDGGGVQTEDTEPIMLGRATGLRQIQAGRPTLGPREIDDYRILQFRRGGHVRPTGAVEIIDGRGAETPRHQIHMREWVWHNIPAPAVEHQCPACGNVHTGVVNAPSR